MDDLDICFTDTQEYSKSEIVEILEQVRNFFDICLNPDPTKIDLTNVAHRCKIDTLSMKIRKIEREILS